jgi:hypothetical protein
VEGTLGSPAGFLAGVVFWNRSEQSVTGGRAERNRASAVVEDGVEGGMGPDEARLGGERSAGAVAFGVGPRSSPPSCAPDRCRPEWNPQRRG